MRRPRRSWRTSRDWAAPAPRRVGDLRRSCARCAGSGEICACSFPALSRLAYGARLGHHVEAADVSVGMAVVARHHQRQCAGRAARPPRRRESGVLDRRACLQSSMLETPRPPPTLTLQTTRLATPPPTTPLSPPISSTRSTAAAAVRTVAHALAPGGVWVNVGPLQWHRPTGLRLTFDGSLALRAVRPRRRPLDARASARALPRVAARLGERQRARLRLLRRARARDRAESDVVGWSY